MSLISCFCDLSNVGVKLDDEDNAIIFLTSVKSTHKHLFNTLLYGRDSVTLEQVKKALSSSEKLEMKDVKSSDDSQELVNRRKGKSYGKKNQSDGGGGRVRRPLRDIECCYCRENGHIVKYCLKKKKDEEECDGPKKDGVAATAREQE